MTSSNVPARATGWPPALVFFRLTLREAVRRRVLWALLGLTLLLVTVTAWGFGRVVEMSRFGELATQLLVSQLVILVAFMFSFVLAMTAVFLGSPALVSEIESGQLLAVLARPVRRADMVVGKWFGYVVIVLLYASASGSLELAVVGAVTGYSPPDPAGAILYLAGEGIVLMTLALLLSARIGAIAGGATAVMLYGLGWIAGLLGSVGVFFANESLVRVADVSRLILPTDLLWRGAIFSLEQPVAVLLAAGRNTALLAANPFYALSPPGPAELAWVAGWILLVLGTTIAIFRRREL